jgi:hypothetical protein
MKLAFGLLCPLMLYLFSTMEASAEQSAAASSSVLLR